MNDRHSDFRFKVSNFRLETLNFTFEILTLKSEYRIRLIDLFYFAWHKSIPELHELNKDAEREAARDGES